ncbi:hypothetical protein ES319_A03G191300v1 [Gossypium barbadense]|uniref:Secreted protein n=3 Tax=Gossypium TaxID=3633 RepID=A0A5J5WHR4_GOSBA|nr:hypothetical protein ES319_A03G191300v1 [Gossypium barbadense]TYH26008.1 hypothetical protein ES288_A03G215500v1 [Gossypium darwinii]TYI37424.1 hypothetical protein ES332_A03G210400v1 [Gossypium tomentosum]
MIHSTIRRFFLMIFLVSTMTQSLLHQRHLRQPHRRQLSGTNLLACSFVVAAYQREARSCSVADHDDSKSSCRPTAPFWIEILDQDPLLLV